MNMRRPENPQYQEVTNPVTLSTTGMTAPYYALSVPQIIGEVNAQTEVDYTLHFNRGVLRVESVDVRPMFVEWDVLNGKVMFHGKLRTEILYVTGEHYVRDRRDEIVSYANYGVIPQAMPGQNVNVYVKVRGVSWDCDQHARVDIHVLLDVFITVTQTIQISVPLYTTVSGQVMLNGVAQANAIVILYDSNGVMYAWTFTSSSGYYKFDFVLAGTYTIVAAVSGTYESRPTTVTANTPVTANFFQAPTTTCTNILSSATCAFITGQLGAV
jgi:hypothetical protein